MYWIDPKQHILKVSCQHLQYWLRYSDHRGRRGKYFDEEDDDGDVELVDDQGQNEGESVLWDHERILKVSCRYLEEKLRYREYRGRGGKCFDDDDGDDDDDDDDDDVDDEGKMKDRLFFGNLDVS